MNPATLDRTIHATLLVVSPLLLTYYLGGKTWALLAAIPIIILPCTIWAINRVYRALVSAPRYDDQNK